MSDDLHQTGSLVVDTNSTQDSLSQVTSKYFETYYGSPAEFLVRAPGRVNIIGEHTDYNGGFVFPAAINYYTYVAVSKRHDSIVNVVARDWSGEVDHIDLTKPMHFDEARMWPNYIRGVVEQLQKRNYPLQGCDLVVSGNVPQGAGLSSSAALEVGIAKALTHASGITLTPLELAQIGQDAENQFVNCACGIMDQLISTSGVEGHAVMIDCRNFETQSVPLPPSYEIIIINSSVQRGLVDSEYNQRRAQCETAAAHYGVDLLRQVSVEQLHVQRGDLDDVSFKRAKHVVEENARVLEMVECLRSSEHGKLFQLMHDSHESMRSLFEITVPAIDFLVELVAKTLDGEGGVRMTGGGFGGCVVALVPVNKVAQVKAAVEANYFNETGLKEVIYTARASAGVVVLSTGFSTDGVG
jgi:galactokinase